MEANKFDYGIWRILLTKLEKHSVYHLIIPLSGGIVVDIILKLLFGDDNKVVKLIGPFKFHLLSLILGVCISWLIVMFILINQESKKRVDEHTLATLEDTLNDATSYHGVSVIPLTEWFQPAVQIYVTRILSRKLQQNNFRHERTLLFFSDEEYRRCTTELMDEYYYGKCLAHMHRDCGIPLSFMQRKDVFALLDKLDDQCKLRLNCDPEWTNKANSNHRRRLPWRRRGNKVDNLDFALVTKPDDSTVVLRLSRHGEKIIIKDDILEGDDAKPYAELVRQIQDTVYKSSKLKLNHNFIKIYGFSDLVQPRQKEVPAQSYQQYRTQSYQEYRKKLFGRMAARATCQFTIKNCTRLITIHDRSGDATVHMNFNEVRSYPKNETRERLPMSFTSKSGFSHAPRFTDDGGGLVRWEWDDGPNAQSQRRGFVVFDSPLKNNSVSFSMETETNNAFHFNQRDRLDVADSAQESVSFNPENLYDRYVIRVQFPERQFPKEFKIQALNENKTRSHKEEKLIRQGFDYLAQDSAVVLTLEKPLAGYTYKIIWDLPENDVDELAPSGQTAVVMREMIKRLATLGSDPAKAENVKNSLNKLQEQFSTASFGPDAIDDAELEVNLHAFSAEKHGLIMVASNGVNAATLIRVGRSTVGQAYRRRALVSWIRNLDSNDSDFWDYGKGHSGIISIPLFYPISGGIRMCVLSIATKSVDSGLLKIIPKLNERNVRRAVLQHINVWYATSLAGALGLPDLRPRSPKGIST